MSDSRGAEGGSADGPMPGQYEIHTDIMFDELEVIDARGIVERCTAEWYNQSLCRVNDSVVRMGVLKGEFHWHSHQDEDEFFLVVEGELMVDLPGRRTETLTPMKGLLIPRGTQHRTRSRQGAVVFMVEGADVVPTGDAPRR